jgi:hypothetical protein
MGDKPQKVKLWVRGSNLYGEKRIGKTFKEVKVFASHNRTEGES